MSVRNKTIVAIAGTFLLGAAAAALASDGSEWIIMPGQGYFVDMQGHTSIISLANVDAMAARAEVVQRGTVFFKHGGNVMELTGFDNPGLH